MLDIALVLFALLVALVLRADPLRRLRPLTLPLVLTAAAGLAHLLADTLAVDDVVRSWTEGALVLAIGFLIARGCLMLLFDWVLTRRMGVTPPRLVREVVALVVYLFLAVVLLRNLGLQVTGLIATSAVITVVVGLALQQTLGNLLAGLALAWEQRLVTGTWIELDGRVGLIEETGWRSLVVRTRVGNRVLVPNSEVGASRVTILGSGQRAVAVPVRLGVAYGVPPDAAKAVLEGVAADIPGVLSDPPPKILTSEFADSAVVYECRLWTHTPWCRDDLTDELLTRAHAALARAGMEIPFPQRTLHRAPRREAADSFDRRLQALRACDLFCDIPEEALGVLADELAPAPLRAGRGGGAHRRQINRPPPGGLRRRRSGAGKPRGRKGQAGRFLRRSGISYRQPADRDGSRFEVVPRGRRDRRSEPPYRPRAALEPHRSPGEQDGCPPARGRVATGREWRPHLARRTRRPVPEAPSPHRRPLEILARVSHQLSAAASDASHPAVLSRLGVLDVLSSTPPRPSGRKPHWARRLAVLATKPGEICGLARISHRVSAVDSLSKTLFFLI